MNPASLKLCKPFLHENLLNIAIGPVTDPELLEELVDAVPNVESLMIHSLTPVESMDSSLSRALAKLSRLEKIGLPQFWYTEQVMEILSRKRYLQTALCSFENPE